MFGKAHESGAGRGAADKDPAGLPWRLATLLSVGVTALALATAPAFAASKSDPEKAEAIAKGEPVALPGLDFVDELGDSASPSVRETLPTGEFSALVYGGVPQMTINFPETGLSGLLTVDHVEQMPLFSNGRAASGVVGDATLNWQLSESFAFSTSFGRRLADTQELSALGIFEDKVSGSFTYYVTPHFHMTAAGTLASPDLVQQPLSNLPADAEASFGAIYQFLPYFSGRVNYTYDMQQNQNPLLLDNPNRNGDPESTVSFTLIGKF